MQYVSNLPVITNKFKFRAITIEEIKNIYKSMKNKPDYNKVTIKIIVDNWNILGTNTRDIINMVSPVEKMLKRNKCDEFRTINILKTWEK